MILVSSFLLFPLFTHAASPADSDTSASQREVWTPRDQLKEVLAKYPNAVLLSREQYESLVREAGQHRKAPPKAPRSAVLTSAKYQAQITGKVAHVIGTFTVNVLSDDWAQLPLTFGGVALGVVTVDGEAALVGETDALAARGKSKPGSNASAGPVEPGSLFLRGKGERSVVVEFSIPIATKTGVSSFEIKLPAVAASVFDMELPPDQRVESPQSIAVKKTPEATTVTAALSPAHPTLALNWRGAGGGSQALAAQVAAVGFYTIDAGNVRAEYDLDIRTPLGNLAAAYSMTMPANAKVLQVTGEEIANWEITDGKLRIALQAGERASAKLHLAMETPSLAAAPSATVTLPVPRFDGVSRMQGTFSIVGDEGVVVKEIVTDNSLETARPEAYPAPHWIASFRFVTPPNSPQVTVEKVRPRFSADLDTRVEFKQEAIFIERTLTLHPEKGEIFEVALTLPGGEELISVRDAGGAEPDWRVQDRKLGLRWTSNDGGNSGKQFKILTRAEPANWSQIGMDGLPFTLGDTKIDGAERVTGYIALKADDAFRLEAEPSETLERRDGRTTPVQGDYAWFRGANFTLRVKVAKRPGEVLAALTGYALPLEGVLDLHAQIGYNFLHSGTRSVRIRVPKEIAANFHFDGPQIAERNLADDVWTIVFQKELTGEYAMKVTGQVAVERTGSVSKPGDGADAGSEKESRFEIAIPVIAPLDAVRTSGVWAIEANTETEITFAAKGMNELDSLLAPRLSDYEPRHRVIGVFTWLGPDYSLTLSGVRHAAASVLTSVVDRLDLDTVVSASGTERNQATYQLRTAGAQYLDVQLPEKSRLLSLSVNDQAIKPVGDRADQVRVELPGTTNGNEALKVSVLYETPKSEWRGSGGYSVHAPKLARTIPILRSQWRLFLPDGFEYTGLESNLRGPALVAERPLMAGILDGSALGITRFARRSEPPDFAAGTTEQQLQLNNQNAAPQSQWAGGFWSGKNVGAKSQGLAETQMLQNELDRRPGLSRAEIERVKQYFVEAQGLIEIGRFDLANKRCDQILAIDKYNIAARKMQEKIDRARGDFGVVAYGETRAAWMADLDMQWSKPVRRSQLHNESGPPAQDRTVANRTMRIGSKLERIVIPKLELHDAKIREAIDFLKNKSVDLDVDSPVGEKGVNIVLNLDTGAAALPPAPLPPLVPGLEPIPAAPGVPPATPPLPVAPIPGLEPIPVVPGAAPAAPPPPVNPEDARITVSLSNIPLIEALRYVTSLATLKFKVEPYAVVIVPASVNTDVLITREYQIRPDLIPRVPQAGGEINPLNLGPVRAGARGRVGPDATKGGKSIADLESAKNWLISNGVEFNGPGAAAVYLPGSSRLIVRNTQEQLDLMDTIIESNQQATSIPRAPAPDAKDFDTGVGASAGTRKDAIVKKLERIIIPKLELRDATVPEAVEFLAKKASDVDFDSPSGERGLNIELDAKAAGRQSTAPGAVSPQAPRVTVSLTNIPLIEALRYVTTLAGLKFAVTDSGISVGDASENADGLVTREWRVRADFLPPTDGIGVAREAAQKWLASNGVQFNSGAAAAFFAPVGRQKMSLGSTGGATSSVSLPASGRLVVRNTLEQLDLIGTILAANDLAESDDQASKLEDSQRVSGLLPMKLDLPRIGRMIVLDGLSAADRVEFRYENWWTRARHLWWCFVLGGFACLAAFFFRITARRRPWWTTCWVALTLTFFPLAAVPSSMPICNALLAGWLVSVVIQRAAARLVFAPKRKEAIA